MDFIQIAISARLAHGDLVAADTRLQTHTKAGSGQELLSTQNRPSAEGLAGLPRDYTGLPRQAPPLRPPLPGDLGKPMLNAGAAPNTATGTAPPDPEVQRRVQEVEAARVSRLFSQTSQQSLAMGQVLSNPAAGTAASPAAMPVRRRTCRIARRPS
jgi:type IV secretion system protein VirB10